MRPPFADDPEFRKLLAGDGGDADLARVALEVARDAYPGLDVDPYLDRLDALAERARDRCTSLDKPRLVLGQINWVLYVEEEFRGNTEHYLDPKNSYINEVIDRKTGLPITLSLLHARIASRLGLDVSGLNTPGHFLLRVEDPAAGMPVFVDPFHSGALLDRAGCERTLTRVAGRPVRLTDDQLEPCPAREVVARLLRNLKAVYLRSDDYPALIPVQKRLAALNPDEPTELRDLGMLYLQTDRPAEAVTPLQTYLDRRPGVPEAEAIRALLKAARRDVAMRN